MNTQHSQIPFVFIDLNPHNLIIATYSRDISLGVVFPKRHHFISYRDRTTILMDNMQSAMSFDTKRFLMPSRMRTIICMCAVCSYDIDALYTILLIEEAMSG